MFRRERVKQVVLLIKDRSESEGLQRSERGRTTVSIKGRCAFGRCQCPLSSCWAEFRQRGRL